MNLAALFFPRKAKTTIRMALAGPPGVGKTVLTSSIYRQSYCADRRSGATASNCLSGDLISSGHFPAPTTVRTASDETRSSGGRKIKPRRPAFEDCPGLTITLQDGRQIELADLMGEMMYQSHDGGPVMDNGFVCQRVQELRLDGVIIVHNILTLIPSKVGVLLLLRLAHSIAYHQKRPLLEALELAVLACGFSRRPLAENLLWCNLKVELAGYEWRFLSFEEWRSSAPPELATDWTFREHPYIWQQAKDGSPSEGGAEDGAPGGTIPLPESTQAALDRKLLHFWNNLVEQQKDAQQIYSAAAAAVPVAINVATRAELLHSFLCDRELADEVIAGVEKHRLSYVAPRHLTLSINKTEEGELLIPGWAGCDNVDWLQRLSGQPWRSPNTSRRIKTAAAAFLIGVLAFAAATYAGLLQGGRDARQHTELAQSVPAAVPAPMEQPVIRTVVDHVLPPAEPKSAAGPENKSPAKLASPKPDSNIIY